MKASFPNWLPESIQRQFPLLHALSKEYEVVLRLVVDDTVMPSIWSELETHDKAAGFLLGIINAVTFWEMLDKTPLHEQRSKFLKAEKALHTLYSNVAECAELQFFMQTCFENALNEILSSNPDPFVCASIVQNGKNNTWLHFSDLMRKMGNEIYEQKSIFINRKYKKGSYYPKRANDENAYRTYLIKRVGSYIKEIFGKKNHRMVADIIQVMTDSTDGLTEDHIAKIINA